MIDWLTKEEELAGSGYNLICGIDEAGRGPLAGPVVAAAVILPAIFSPDGIRDSKVLSEPLRRKAYARITRQTRAYAIGIASRQEIDQLNILQATFLAMRRAITKLSPQPDYLLVDGNRAIPGVTIPQTTVIGGDAKVLSIAAASIIAKVTRDQIMCDLHRNYPDYRFDQHKGYPTKLHRQEIREYGPSPVHRKSFNLLGKEANLELEYE